MNQKFKITPNTLAIFCIMVLSLVAGLVNTVVNSRHSQVATVQDYQNAVWPLNILDGAKTLVLLLMVFLIYRLVKSVLNGQLWEERYYVRMKTIGWIAILVLFMDAVSFVGREQALEAAPLGLSDSKLYSNAILQLLFSSPVAWFLVLSIFLTADVLHYVQSSKNAPTTGL